MPWIKFSDRKPIEGGRLITRHPAKGGCSYFESWNKWDKKYLNICSVYNKNCHISHWWDGEHDFEFAIESYFKQYGEK